MPKTPKKPKPAPSRRRRIVRRTLWIVGALLVLCGLAAGGYLFYVAQSYNTQRQVVEDPFTPPPTQSQVATPDAAPRPPELTGDAAGSQNILLLGSDTRNTAKNLSKAGDQRADTIMVLHIDAEHKHVYVMSILRDSWVEIPGYGYNKVNAALALGGLPLTVRTVENLIDSRIDQVAVIDFEGFKDLTTALNGVTVKNAKAFQDYGYTYKQGKITVSGDRALVYVRERHAFPDGDYQRVRNQQAFLRGVLQKLLDRDTLQNPIRISLTVNAISPYLTTTKGLDAAYLAGLAWDMRDITQDDVHLFTIPTSGTGYQGAQSVVYVNETKLNDLQHLFRADALEKYKRAL